MNIYLTWFLIWTLPGVLVTAWILADRWLDGRADTNDWCESDAEWMASLSDTPIYEQLAVEQLRADVEDWSARERGRR